MKRLKYEADVFRAHAGTAILVEFRQIGAIQVDMPLRRQIEPGEQCQQR